MKKIWIVLKAEFINTFTRRSFLLTLILVPLLPALILGGITLFSGGDGVAGIENIFQPAQDTQFSEGLVDQAKIIIEMPDWLEEGRLVPFVSEEDARNAVMTGEITGYYVIQPNYLNDGSIRYVREEFNPMTALDTTGFIEDIIQFNLLGSDQARFQTYQNPALVQRVNLAPDDVQRDDTSLLAFYIPYGMTMLFYVLIFSSASLMLNSIAKEKENRVMEILMSSIKPNQILTGKILGLGLVGLLQMIVWMGSALLMLRLGGSTLNIPPSLQLPTSILLWGIAFFILGYLLYATIMAGVGAFVPNVKEASQATFIIILPILIPLLMIGVIINEPDTTLPVMLSLIPFTAPNTIMTRLAVGPVPLWQLLLSIGLMILTIIFLIRAVSRMFQAQQLLTGKRFKIGLFLRTLFGHEHETSGISEG